MKLLENLKPNSEAWRKSLDKLKKNLRNEKYGEKIEIRTKKIGGHKLNEIVIITYEKCICGGGGWIVRLVEKRCICGLGKDKTEAKDNFEKEFGRNLHRVKNLLQ